MAGILGEECGRMENFWNDFDDYSGMVLAD
jgi:hypothetical protein